MRHTRALQHTHLPMQTGVHTSSRRGTRALLTANKLLPVKLLLLPRKTCAVEAASGARSRIIISIG